MGPVDSTLTRRSPRFFYWPVKSWILNIKRKLTKSLAMENQALTFQTTARTELFLTLIKAHAVLYRLKADGTVPGTFSNLANVSHNHANSIQDFFFFAHRAIAAFRAISRRRSAVKFSLRFLPPRLPRRLAYSPKSSGDAASDFALFFLFDTLTA